MDKPRIEQILEAISEATITREELIRQHLGQSQAMLKAIANLLSELRDSQKDGAE